MRRECKLGHLLTLPKHLIALCGFALFVGVGFSVCPSWAGDQQEVQRSFTNAAKARKEPSPPVRQDRPSKVTPAKDPSRPAANETVPPRGTTDTVQVPTSSASGLGKDPLTSPKGSETTESSSQAGITTVPNTPNSSSAGGSSPVPHLKQSDPATGPPEFGNQSRPLSVPIAVLVGVVVVIMLSFFGLARGPSAEAIWERTGRRVARTIMKRRTVSRLQDAVRSTQLDPLLLRFQDLSVLGEWVLPPNQLQADDIICFYGSRPFGISTKVDLPSLGSISMFTTGLSHTIVTTAPDLIRAKADCIRIRSVSAPFFNGPVVKLERSRICRDPQSGRGKVVLWLRPTSYFTFVCTNETLEEASLNYRPLVPVGSGDPSLTPEEHAAFSRLSSAREKMMAALKSSADGGSAGDEFLANNLAVNLNIITKDSKLLYVSRSVAVARKQSFLSSAVSGDIDPSAHSSPKISGARGDLDADGCPSPLQAAIREAAEELNVVLEEKDVTFLALCRNNASRQPFFIGQALCGQTFDEVLRTSPLARDLYERNELFSIDLTDSPVSILSALRQNETNWGRPSLLGVYLTLVRRFGLERTVLH